MLDDGEKTTLEIPKTEWWITLLAFVSGLIVMYLLKFLPSFKWKEKSRTFKESEALKILYPHLNESQEIEEMVRKLYAKKNGDKNISIDKKQLKDMIEKINK